MIGAKGRARFPGLLTGSRSSVAPCLSADLKPTTAAGDRISFPQVSPGAAGIVAAVAIRLAGGHVSS